MIDTNKYEILEKDGYERKKEAYEQINLVYDIIPRVKSIYDPEDKKHYIVLKKRDSKKSLRKLRRTQY